MPYLYYGSHGKEDSPRLYSKDMGLIKTDLFDQFKIDELAPLRSSPNLALIWHLKGHTALAWWNDRGYQQAVFIPGELDERHAIFAARETWPNKIPGPLLFRIENEGEIYEL